MLYYKKERKTQIFYSFKMKILKAVWFSLLVVSKASASCPLICEENEVYTNCTLAQFQSTCWNRHIWFDKTSIDCLPGCQCRDGFVRDPNSYKCIDLRNCQRAPPEGVCPKNEFWSECGFRCDETCEFLNNRDLICRSCVEGCICQQGFVRSTLTGQCILKRDCDGIYDVNSKELCDNFVLQFVDAAKMRFIQSVDATESVQTHQLLAPDAGKDVFVKTDTLEISVTNAF